MKTEKLDFHINSREPFAEEAPVLAAVEQARKQIGQLQGSALFRTNSHVSAEPTVIPRAVDIIRGGMKTAVQQAMERGYVQGARVSLKALAVEAAYRGQIESIEASAERPSAIRIARNEVSDSLRRLGVSS
jgi:hypothetical protein